MNNERCLFVYGTLKKDKENSFLLESEKFIGYASTLEKYPMLKKKDIYYPFLLNKPTEGNIISGELYLVSNKTLFELDMFEGPQYYRDEIEVICVGNVMKVHVYFSKLRNYNENELISDF